MRQILHLVAAIAALAASGHASAEAIKIGVLKTTGTGPVYIAQEQGYFAAEGLTSELVSFESAQPIAVATASGDIDFGYTGFTGGFFGLASQGVLRIVGAGAHEVPGVAYQPLLVSNHAYDAGVHGFADFPGHSFAVSQIGSPPHYALGLLAAKYGFDIKSMRILPLQSLPNVVSALVGGQADTTMIPGNIAVPLIERHTAHLLGYVGDETPYQLAGIVVSTKTADERRNTVERALRAFNKGARAYYDAFIGADGKRHDGPNAAAMLALIAKDAGQSVDEVARSLPYVDRDGRLDVKDVLRQDAWYRAQGLVKGPVEGKAIIDTRYVAALP